MVENMLNIFSTSRSGKASNLVEFLDNSSFDEKFEINLKEDVIRNLYHVENKYLLPNLSGSFREMYEYGKRYMVEAGSPEINGMMDPSTLEERLKNSETPGIIKSECREKLVDGTYRWVEYVGITGEEHGVPKDLIYFYVFDIQNQWDRQNGQAGSDVRFTRRNPVTGLREREAFVPAAQKLRQSQSYSQNWCCIAIDIQHFKLFNTWFGQDKGDYVLGGIGEVLRDLEEEKNAVAVHFGRDNFGVFMPYEKSVVDNLYTKVREVIHYYSNHVGFLPAFGIHILEEGSEITTDIYDRARIAVEEAKNTYNHRIRFFNNHVYSQKKEEYALLTAFQHALNNNEIQFHVQPLCNLVTGKIMGGEALVRWIKEDGSMVNPGAFIPFLEKYGFIVELDKTVWEEVCKWIRSLMNRGIRPLPISINVSRIDLLSMDVSAYLYGLTQRYNVPCRFVNIEITESAYAEDFEVVSKAVSRLKEMGFKVYMDDFGNGYSSLNMLDKINTDVLKLDMAFMKKESALSKKGISIVESIISLTKTLGIPMIVEGVENEEQVNFLKNLGCLFAQGYYFYRPMDTAKFEQLLKQADLLDLEGVRLRATELFHTRAFLNDSLFTDSMLNGILGPVAVYALDKDGGLNITRFNQQFYECIADVNMESRQKAIHNYIVQEDWPRFYQMLEDALNDHVNGGECTVRFYKSHGGVYWFNMHLYFLRDSEQGKLFYGKIEDRTESYQQRTAFYELLRSNCDYCMKIDLKTDQAYVQRKDRSILEQDPAARSMNVVDSMAMTARVRIPEEEERKRFLAFFDPERLKESRKAGMYSEIFHCKFQMDSQYVLTRFSLHYVKSIPGQENMVYIFVNREWE